MTTESLKKFLKDHPAISPDGIGQEAGLGQGYINHILTGRKPLTDKTASKLEPVLLKYGYRK